jgi:hypothetical protein
MPLFNRLYKQCEGLDMPLLSFCPSEAHLITDSYNFVVDALFGLTFDGNLELCYAEFYQIFIQIAWPLHCLYDL